MRGSFWKEFLRFCRFGINWKSFMGLYFCGLFLMYAFFLFLLGERSIPLAIPFEMLLVSVALTVLQKLFFGEREHRLSLPVRTALHLPLFFAVIIAPAVWLGWFPVSAPWLLPVSVAVLGFLYVAFFVWVNLLTRFENRLLNEQLTAFQREQRGANAQHP